MQTALPDNGIQTISKVILKLTRGFAPIAPSRTALQNPTPRRRGCDLSGQTVLSSGRTGKEIANNQPCNGLISAPGDSEPPSLIQARELLCLAYLERP